MIGDSHARRLATRTKCPRCLAVSVSTLAGVILFHSLSVGLAAEGAGSPPGYPDTGQPATYPETEYPSGYPLLVETPPEEEDQSWFFTSPFANISWPEIKLPQVEWRPMWSGPEGGWLGAPLHVARSTARGALHRTRTAWNNTLDRMKFILPGGSEERNSSTHVASEPRRGPGFWGQLLGRLESGEGHDGVVEMTAHERLDP